MSYSSLFNSPTYGKTYTLTNSAGAIALPTVGVTLFEPKIIIAASPSTATTPIFITIPAGVYSVKMNCAIQPASASSAINFAQLVIVDDTDVLYGAGSSFNKVASATTANRPANQLFINETIFITLTTTKQLTMRLNYNITVAAGATISGELGLYDGTTYAAPNPRIPCENNVVFTSLL